MWKSIRRDEKLRFFSSNIFLACAVVVHCMHAYRKRVATQSFLACGCACAHDRRRGATLSPLAYKNKEAALFIIQYTSEQWQIYSADESHTDSISIEGLILFSLAKTSLVAIEKGLKWGHLLASFFVFILFSANSPDFFFVCITFSHTNQTFTYHNLTNIYYEQYATIKWLKYARPPIKLCARSAVWFTFTTHVWRHKSYNLCVCIIRCNIFNKQYCLFYNCMK